MMTRFLLPVPRAASYYLDFRVKEPRVEVSRRPRHALPSSQPHPGMCHWYISEGHRPTPSRSGDLASDVPLGAPQTARVGLVGGGAQWTWLVG